MLIDKAKNGVSLFISCRVNKRWTRITMDADDLRAERARALALAGRYSSVHSMGDTDGVAILALQVLVLLYR